MGCRQLKLSAISARPVSVVEKQCHSVAVDDLGHRAGHSGGHVLGAHDFSEGSRQIQKGPCGVGLMTGILHGVGRVEGRRSQLRVGLESPLCL